MSPINKWDSFLANKPLEPNTPKQETDNTYLNKGFTGLIPIASKNNISAVFLLGDVLSHHFTNDYNQFAPSQYKSQKYLTEFSAKTILYLLHQLKTNLPNTKIYMVLGNNDSDNGNYHLPSKLFLVSLAKQLSLSEADPRTFINTFADGGYFSTAVNKKVTLIGLNTNILSSTNPNIDEAIRQFNWLKQELFIAKSAHRHVIIIQHIPFGIDMFKTAMLHKLMPVLEQNLQGQYLSLFKEYSSIITTIYAAHYHNEYLATAANIPIIGNLAFNSLYGNTPGFKVINIDGRGYLTDYTTYTDQSHENDKIHWNKLYSFALTYGNPVNIVKILKLFPVGMSNPKVIAYRKYYNGNNVLFHQPISLPTGWKYYYCAINNMTLLGYGACLSAFSSSRFK